MLPHHQVDSDSSSASSMTVAVAPRQDRRKGDRRTHRLSVKVLAARAGDAVSFMGLTENLSAEGVFVATRAPCAIGTSVDLIVGLPEQKILRVRGRVRWRRFESSHRGTPPGIGIRFERLSAEDADRIRAFVLLESGAEETVQPPGQGSAKQ